jgi:hypothetical protein
LFRHPDYAEEKFTLTNQTDVSVSLEQKLKGIEEVILNAGYYKVKDEEEPVASPNFQQKTKKIYLLPIYSSTG